MFAHPKRVMVVEDAIDIQLLLRRLLTREGYEVLCATNGHEALQLLALDDSLPEVIMLDLTMPVMDGFTFRERQVLDERIAHIPVILMTAAGELQASALQIGARATLKKPFQDLETILRTVATFFDSL